MNKNIKVVLKYFIELIIVAFGVFLGFYLSNISADRNTQVEKEKTLQLIVKELENNQKLLEPHIKYHEKIKHQIDSLIPALSEKDMQSFYIGNKHFRHDKIKGWKGLQYAQLENIAFEVAKISGIIREYDIELIQNISSVYNHQKRYTDLGALITKKASEFNSSSKVADVIGTIELMSMDLLYAEKRLNKQLETTIDSLKSLYKTGI